MITEVILTPGSTTLATHSNEWYSPLEMAAELSRMQARVLAAIRRRAESGEPPPSYRDLCAEFRWASTGTVRDHLKALARKGCIELSHHRHRRIRIREGIATSAGVPLLGRIVAGVPALAEQNIERHLAVPAEWTRSGVHFSLRVTGDSMIGAGILPDDCVVVRQQRVAGPGEVAVVTLSGETTLKRVERRGDRFVLVPQNPKYSEIPVETEAAQIQGVVIGLIREYLSKRIQPLATG